MKVGILTLLREGKKVEHVTNQERWDWMLWSFEEDDPKELAINFVPLKSTKDAVTKSTTVTVYHVTEEDIHIENYLFLSQPPSNMTYTTDYGSILLGDKYCRKIFEQGILVDRHKAGRGRLQYGLDFESGQVDLGRDRA